MTTAKLKDTVRQIILAELRKLLDEFKQVRSLRLSESDDDTTRKDYIAKRMDVARGKLDDLKNLQRRDKEVRDRRKTIEKENGKHD